MINLFVLASASLFHYVSAPVANMREQPSDASEIVSSAYFSEQVNVLEESGDWTKIETSVDHYQGWMKSNQLCHRQDAFPSKSANAVAKINRCMAHLYHVQDTVYGPVLTIPSESLLEVTDPEYEKSNRWIKVCTVDGRVGYIQRGDITFNNTFLNRDRLPSFSLQFLGLPYTWGGRSSFGYDCSGFVQMLYRQIGVYLPRDSKDQVKWEGLEEISMGELAPGDLIYFGLDKDRVRHVGMYIGQDQFINATVAEDAPNIHISCLSDLDWNGSGKWKYRTARRLKN